MNEGVERSHDLRRRDSKQRAKRRHRSQSQQQMRDQCRREERPTTRINYDYVEDPGTSGTNGRQDRNVTVGEGCTREPVGRRYNRYLRKKSYETLLTRQILDNPLERARTIGSQLETRWRCRYTEATRGVMREICTTRTSKAATATPEHP